MNGDLVTQLKKREENLRESIAKMRGILEIDKDKVKNDEMLLGELNGRFIEVQYILKELEKKEA
jgi:hypothetical protein